MSSEYERIEAEMDAIRNWAEAQGRGLTDDERQQLNDFSIERATAYRTWQGERNRANAGTIITGQQIFRHADRRRQWTRIALIGGMIILMTFFRYQRYSDRQSVASDSYIPPDYTTEQTLSSSEQQLADRLPGDELLPEGIAVYSEWPYGLDEAADDSDDPEEHRLRLISWGYTGSVHRYFEFSDDQIVAGVDGLYDLDVQITQFDSVSSATAAARFQHTQQLGWWNDDRDDDVQAASATLDEPFGDASFAMHVPYSTYGARMSQLYVWVVDGPYLYEYWTITDTPAVPAGLATLVNRTLAGT